MSSRVEPFVRSVRTSTRETGPTDLADSHACVERRVDPSMVLRSAMVSTRAALTVSPGGVPVGGAIVVFAGVMATIALGSPFAAVLAAAALVLAWAVRARTRAPRAEGGPRVERVGGCALGQREAVHVVRVGSRRLVLGVTQSSVTLLATLPEARPASVRRRRRLRLARMAVLVALALCGADAAAAQEGPRPPESTEQIAGENGPFGGPSQTPGVAAPAPPAPHVEAPQLAPPGGAIVWIALLALAPFALMCVTSFVKISVVLSLLRSALGTPQAPSDPALAAIALALTLFVMAPVTRDVVARIEARSGSLDTAAGAFAAAADAAEPLRGFLERNTRPEEVALFVELSTRDGAPAAEASSFAVLVPAFVTTELREAFVVGFLVFLPFLVVDLVVANILMSMGMVMVSPASVSLPFKVLLFVLVDGWPLLMKGLALGYR